MHDTNDTEHTLRCIAIDDEPFARKLIADDISKIPFLKLAGTYSSTAEGLEILKKGGVDLLFLDVQMPVMTGIQFLKTLKDPPFVILTTAYEQYALEGFELDVVDYLLKPIPFERFLKGAHRAYDQFVLEKAHAPSRTFFFVYSEYKELKVFCDDVLYIEGLKDYVKIFQKSSSRPILTRLNLKAMESRLPSDQFVRIHQSFIVSLSKITSTQKTQVFIGDKAIPIGDKYADSFGGRYR
jgi:DNA-binding LytR/AlgR family response regulator